MNNPYWLMALALAWGLHGQAAAAAAQPSSGAAPSNPPASADPTQARAPVPALAYRSALQIYRPWREQAPGDWRALNDEVTRIGGWRSYLREVHQTLEAPVGTPPKPTPALAAPALNATEAAASTKAAPGTVAEPAPAPKGHGHGHH